MDLTPQEEVLINVIRKLPPDEAGKMLTWAQQLGELSGGAPVDWSDSWSEEDMADVTRAAIQRFE